MTHSTSLGTAPTLAVACTDKAADVYTLPTGLPAMDMTHRGDILHCAVTESLTADKVNAQITGYNANYTVPVAPAAATSGFWSYRVAYRTLRNTPSRRARPPKATARPSCSSPRSRSPARRSSCSRTARSAWRRSARRRCSTCRARCRIRTIPVNLYRLAGYGYTVIAPDYSGFSYAQPPGYFNAEDEAHSVLDATRAAANLLTTMPDKVVFVGHSQGGHAALSAQTYAKAYGMHGTLAGVAVFAPLWTSMSIWAAGTTAAGGPDDERHVVGAVHDGVRLLGGRCCAAMPADGLAVFQTAKQQAAKDTILGGDCYDSAKLKALGAGPSDFFDAN